MLLPLLSLNVKLEKIKLSYDPTPWDSEFRQHLLGVNIRNCLGSVVSFSAIDQPATTLIYIANSAV